MTASQFQHQAQDNKAFFDACAALGEGIFDSVHILQLDDIEREGFRVYHRDGYCIDVYSEEVDVEEFFTAQLIDGKYYGFASDTFEGFTPITAADALALLAAALGLQNSAT